MSEYLSTAVTLMAEALRRAKSPGDVMTEWWRLYDNASGMAEIMEYLDQTEDGARPYRVRNCEIVSCVQREDGGWVIEWREPGEEETREARLGNLANPVYRAAKEAAERCLAQGLRARLLGGYEPNTNGWSTTIKGKTAIPDHFRRIFRVQPITDNARPAPAPMAQTEPAAPSPSYSSHRPVDPGPPPADPPPPPSQPDVPATPPAEVRYQPSPDDRPDVDPAALNAFKAEFAKLGPRQGELRAWAKAQQPPIRLTQPANNAQLAALTQKVDELFGSGERPNLSLVGSE